MSISFHQPGEVLKIFKMILLDKKYFRFISPYRQNLKFLEEGLENTHKLYDDIIKKHQQNIKDDSNFEPTNLLDSFLVEREKKENTPEARFYNERQLKYLLADMFGAGLDTTLSTLR